MNKKSLKYFFTIRIFNVFHIADIYNGNGDGGESVHGPFFEDENFAVSHSARGILGMANQVNN